MNTKLDVSVVLAVALGCVSLSAAANVKYTPELTNEWINVTGSDLGSAVITEGAPVGSGGWYQVPAAGGAIAGDNEITIDTDSDHPLVFTNAASVGKSVYRIEAELTIKLSTELPTIGVGDLADAKTALCVCTNGLDGAEAATNWWGYIGGEWKVLNGTPELDATYVIALDSDTEAGMVRYFATQDGGKEVELTDGWQSNSSSTTPITKLAFAGYTDLSSITGNGFAQGYGVEGGETYASFDDAIADAIEKKKDLYTPVKTNGVVVASAKIDATWLEDKGINTEESLNAIPVGGNGMAYWQSYVLGLEPATATDKPVVLPKQDNNASVVSFSIGNVSVKPGAGVPVKYRVNTYNSPTDAIPSASGGFVVHDQSATVELPTGVKYYKMEIKFGE